MSIYGEIFVFITAFVLLKKSLVRLYRFPGQLKVLRPCKIAGHDAESKTYWTSKLFIITSPLFSSMDWMNTLASIAAAIVFLWE